MEDRPQILARPFQTNTMKEKFYQHKGFIPTLVTSLLIIIILELLQSQSGPLQSADIKLKILGGGGGAILAIGLLFRWEFARYFLVAIILLATLSILNSYFNGENLSLLTTILLLTGTLTSLYLLVGSKSVKYYIEGK